MSPAGFLSDVLARIECTRSTYSLAFESRAGEPLGEILVAEGEICLVTLPCGSVPLGIRLKQRFPETAAAVHEALVRVRAEGRPLGEVLTGLGTVRSDQIRASLLDQTTDGLVIIARSAPLGVIETCLSVSRRRVPTVLSAFSPADIYWRATPLLLPAGDDPVARCFEDVMVHAELAILVARGEAAGGEAIPVATRGLASLSVGEGLDLGRAVERIASAPGLVAAGLSPGVSLFRSAIDVAICAASMDRIAIACGLDVPSQSRALSLLRPLWAGGQ